MERVGSIVIDLVDEGTATPAYTLSWEDHVDINDPVYVYACGCGRCSGKMDYIAGCSKCGFHCPPLPGTPPGGQEDEDENIGGSEGTGGGGGTPPPPPIGTPVLARPNLPRMSVQRANWCVPNSMAFVNRFFGGNRTHRDFSRLFKSMFNRPIDEDGATTSEVEAMVRQNFNTITFTSYQSAIDQGYVVMVTIREPIHPLIQVANVQMYGQPLIPEAHSVVVVGYKSGTDQLITMDPITGGQNTISESEVLSNLYQLVITGNQ